MSTDVATWLLAQLDEDERDADGTHHYNCANHVDDGLCTCSVPQRIRADIAAKRRIVMQFVQLSQDRRRLTHAALHLQWNVLRQVVEQLALPYADRPGYDPAWTPGEAP